MNLDSFITHMPKVELHVHLEGSIQPETLLELARRNDVALPATTVEGLRDWYVFRDFPHFIEIYKAISRCLRTPDDLELVARAFLTNQAAQYISYSEVTFTAYTHFQNYGMPFREQLAALNRACRWAEQALGTSMGLIIDIARETSAARGMEVANWVIDSYGNGIVALGLGGYEVGNPPGKFALPFARARAAGVPLVLHAGETVGPDSIWAALREDAQRIGHGVRCVEDPALVAELRARQIPLEVCPSSNVCLGVVPSLAAHPFPQLLAEGLFVTLNSDDPPMFNTTLTEEYLRVSNAFELERATIEQLVINAARATLLPPAERNQLESDLRAGFAQLNAEA